MDLRPDDLSPGLRRARLAGLQALAEVSLGSLVHGFKIPLGGHLLSLNQSFLLSWAMRDERTRREGVRAAASISNTAAALKALSPLGQRLTPMLAISVQGTLFSVGVACLGPTLPGVAIGSAVASLWGFAQPLLLGYAFFGRGLFDAITRLWVEIAYSVGVAPEWGVRLLFGLVAAKALLAAVVGTLGIRVGPARLESYLKWVELGARSARHEQGAISAWREIFSVPFIVCLALSVGFLALSGQASSNAEIVWYILRVLAVAWLVSWVACELPRSRRLQAWIEQRPELRSASEFVLSRLSARSSLAGDPAPESAVPPR